MTSTTLLSDIQGWIVPCENAGGGWVPLAFISVCDGCMAWSITEADFSSLMAWLAARAPQGTVVKTVREVISGVGRSRPFRRRPIRPA